MKNRVTVWLQHFADREALQLQWIDPGSGRRRTKTTGTADRKSAEKIRSDWEYELNHGQHRECTRQGWQAFRELFEDEYLPNLRPDTRAVYRTVLDHFERIIGPVDLASITERSVSRFAAGLRQVKGRGPAGREGMQPSTLRVRLQFFQTALRWAAKQKLLAGVPEFPEVKVPRRRPQPVAVELFERLLAAARDPHLRVLVFTGWLAGLRLNEARCLEWEETDEAPWLDLPGEQVVLPACFVKAVEDQTVPVDPVLRTALEALPRTDRRVIPWRGPSGNYLSRPSFSRKVVELAEAAGVRLTMRSLRRGFGCHHAAHVPAQVLQRLMRHGDIAVTMRFYANTDQAAREAILGPKRNTGT
jgi:integrase